jgi:hypothetical protein
MIPLPQNVYRIHGETITLRFGSTDDCGYKMLFEAASAKLGHRMIALDNEEQAAAESRGYVSDRYARSIDQIRADKDRAITALNGSRFVDGEGQHCLTMSVADAISLVAPIEQIKRLSAMGVPITGHAFTTAQVDASATQILERFERSIQQVADAANTQDLGMFPQAPGYGR